MASEGLRERKKRRTSELIAATAARLFAEHGYEQVTVLYVAAAAELSEQTVYNHFPTKQTLVLDRDEDLRDQLVTLIADRPAGVSPAAAIRDAALSMVEELRTMDNTQMRGGLGYLFDPQPSHTSAGTRDDRPARGRNRRDARPSSRRAAPPGRQSPRHRPRLGLSSHHRPDRTRHSSRTLTRPDRRRARTHDRHDPGRLDTWQAK